MGKYEDIINLPHHVSTTRPQMSMMDRAAQFSPFAALTGYDAAIKETGRLTDEKIEMDEEALNILSTSPSEQKVRSVSLALKPSVKTTPKSASRSAFRDVILASVRCKLPAKVSRLSLIFRTASRLRKARDMNTGRRSTISKKLRKRSTILLKTISCNMPILRKRLRTFTDPMPVPVKS